MEKKKSKTGSEKSRSEARTSPALQPILHRWHQQLLVILCFLKDVQLLVWRKIYLRECLPATLRVYSSLHLYNEDSRCKRCIVETEAVFLSIYKTGLNVSNCSAIVHLCCQLRLSVARISLMWLEQHTWLQHFHWLATLLQQGSIFCWLKSCLHCAIWPTESLVRLHLSKQVEHQQHQLSPLTSV